MELFNVIAVEEVKPLLKQHFSRYKLGTETVAVEEAVDRVLAVDIVSDLQVPAFRRSTKDGYAVRSADVSGASESEPVELKLNGEILMGTAAFTGLKHGETVYVPTGGMIPDGADALVMIEYARTLSDDAIAVIRSVAVKENVINIGEDINEGAVVLRTGRRMTPADLGVLTSVGISSVEVFVKPKVSIISTGDEIAAPGEELTLGMVRDINTYTVSAAAEKAGCEVVIRRVVRDDEELLKKVLAECHKASDIVFISGGSSVGIRDYSLPAISSLGSPGILCHGIAFKPGKPTIIAKAGEKTGHRASGAPCLGAGCFQYSRRIPHQPDEPNPRENRILG